MFLTTVDSKDIKIESLGQKPSISVVSDKSTSPIYLRGAPGTIIESDAINALLELKFQLIDRSR